MDIHKFSFWFWNVDGRTSVGFGCWRIRTYVDLWKFKELQKSAHGYFVTSDLWALLTNKSGKKHFTYKARNKSKGPKKTKKSQHAITKQLNWLNVELIKLLNEEEAAAAADCIIIWKWHHMLEPIGYFNQFFIVDHPTKYVNESPSIGTQVSHTKLI